MTVSILKREQDPDVVAYLEQVLERARSGQVRGVLILEQDHEGLSYSCAGVKGRFEMIGWLSHAIYKLHST